MYILVVFFKRGIKLSLPVTRSSGTKLTGFKVLAAKSIFSRELSQYLTLNLVYSSFNLAQCTCLGNRIPQAFQNSFIF